TPTGELARFGDRLICGYCKDAYAQKLREGVPAQNVVRYGGFWIRFVAYFIDSIIVSIGGSVIQLAIFGLPTVPAPDPNNPFGPLMSLMPQLVGRMAVGTVLSLVYFTLFWWKLGAS